MPEDHEHFMRMALEEAAKGKAEGKAEGKVEGMQEGEASLVLRLLKRQIGEFDSASRREDQREEQVLGAFSRFVTCALCH